MLAAVRPGVLIAEQPVLKEGICIASVIRNRSFQTQTKSRTSRAPPLPNAMGHTDTYRVCADSQQWRKKHHLWLERHVRRGVGLKSVSEHSLGRQNLPQRDI